MPFRESQFEQCPEMRTEKKEGEKILINEYEKKARKYFGERQDEDYQTYTVEDQKCWYFSPRSKEEGDIVVEEGLKINGLHKEAERAFYKDKALGIDIEQGEGAKFLEEHFDEICQEYKIHLQPTREEYDPRQKDWRPFCLNKLIKVLAENKGLRESIDRFKISYQKEIKRSSGGQPVPEIVIYPRHGRENFGKVLAGVYQQFKDYGKYGSDINPRHNLKINELIFIAQSGGDFKEYLKYLGVIDNYFDKENNYAFRKGEKPPLTIEGSESFVELFVALDHAFPNGLQGAEKNYEVSELKKLINKVRSGKFFISHITRAGGLREKVNELLNKEK